MKIKWLNSKCLRNFEKNAFIIPLNCVKNLSYCQTQPCGKKPNGLGRWSVIIIRNSQKNIQFCLGPKFYLRPNFLVGTQKNFRTHILFRTQEWHYYQKQPNFFQFFSGPKFYLRPKFFLEPKLFWGPNFLGDLNLFSSVALLSPSFFIHLNLIPPTQGSLVTLKK